MQLRAIQEEGMRPEFQKGDMMLRFYSARENLWMNVVEPLEFPADPRKSSGFPSKFLKAASHAGVRAQCHPSEGGI